MAIKIFAYISPICREAPLGQIYMKFCVRGHLADVINRAKFYLNQLRGFDSAGGSNFWLSHKKEKSPLTQGLNYRSACDDICANDVFVVSVAVTMIVTGRMLTSNTDCKVLSTVLLLTLRRASV